MRHICILHRNDWFSEYFEEFTSWPDIQVVDPADVTYDQAQDPDVHYHIWGQSEWFATANRLPAQRACRITFRYIEQVPLGNDHGSSDFQRALFRSFLALASRFDEIYISGAGSEISLRRWLPDLSDRVVRIPLGYSPYFGSPDFNCKQDIDILAYGLRNPRRVAVWRLLSQHLRDLRMHAVANIWGQERNDLIHRARILLHIQSVPRLYPTIRMWRALANGAFWVTEEVGDPSPVVAGRDFAEVETITPETVVSVSQRLRNWLSRPHDRDVIRRQGHETVKRLPARTFFAEICRRVEALSACGSPR
jgi:hypothetical protein